MVCGFCLLAYNLIHIHENTHVSHSCVPETCSNGMQDVQVFLKETEVPLPDCLVLKRVSDLLEDAWSPQT